MIFIKKGPYGPYMQLGEGTKEKKPKRVSIPKNIEPDELGLNTAIRLIRTYLESLAFIQKQTKQFQQALGCMVPMYYMIKNIKL